MASRTIDALIPVQNLQDNIPLQLSLSRSVFRFDADGNPTPDNQSAAITAHVGQGLDASRVVWTGALSDGSVASLNRAMRLLGVRAYNANLGDSGGTEHDDFIVSDVRYVPDQVVSNSETLIEGVGNRSSIEGAWPVTGGFEVGHNRREVERYSVAADGTVAHVGRRSNIPSGLSPSNNIASVWYDEDSRTWTVINRDGTIRSQVGSGGIRQHANFTVSPALALGLADDDTFLVSTRTAAHLYQLRIPDKNIVSSTAPSLRTTLTGIPGYQRISGASFHVGGIVRVATDDYVIVLDGTMWQVTLDSGSWDINQIGSFTGGARFMKPLLMISSLTGRQNVRYFTASQMGTADSFTVTATLGAHQDSQTILRVRDGDPAVVVSVTNDTITLTQNDDGTVSNFDGATGQLNVHKGLALLDPSDYTSSMVTSSGITATYNHTSRTYAVTGITAAQAEGMLTFTVSAEGQQYTRIVNVRKGNLGRRAGRNASREIRGDEWDNSQANLAVAENPTTRSVFDSVTDINDGVWWRKPSGPVQRIDRTSRLAVVLNTQPNTPVLPTAITEDDDDRYMFNVFLWGTGSGNEGRVTISVGVSRSSDGGTGEDFTAAWERPLRFAFRYKDRTLVVQISSDFTDPYNFTASNSAEVIAFADFVAADADRATQNIDMVIVDSTSSSSVSLTDLTVPFAPVSGNIISDIVTLYNAAGTFAETRTWDGSNWIAFTSRFAGNVLVDNSIVASKIAAHTITAEQVRADVINVRVLWDYRNQSPARPMNITPTATLVEFDVPNFDYRDYDFIQFMFEVFEAVPSDGSDRGVAYITGSAPSALLLNPAAGREPYISVLVPPDPVEPSEEFVLEVHIELAANNSFNIRIANALGGIQLVSMFGLTSPSSS